MRDLYKPQPKHEMSVSIPFPCGGARFLFPFWLISPILTPIEEISVDMNYDEKGRWIPDYALTRVFRHKSKKQEVVT